MPDPASRPIDAFRELYAGEASAILSLMAADKIEVSEGWVFFTNGDLTSYKPEIRLARGDNREPGDVLSSVCEFDIHAFDLEHVVAGTEGFERGRVVSGATLDQVLRVLHRNISLTYMAEMLESQTRQFYTLGIRCTPALDLIEMSFQEKVTQNRFWVERFEHGTFGERLEAAEPAPEEAEAAPELEVKDPDRQYQISGDRRSVFDYAMDGALKIGEMMSPDMAEGFMQHRFEMKQGKLVKRHSLSSSRALTLTKAGRDRMASESGFLTRHIHFTGESGDVLNASVINIGWSLSMAEAFSVCASNVARFFAHTTGAENLIVRLNFGADLKPAIQIAERDPESGEWLQLVYAANGVVRAKLPPEPRTRLQNALRKIGLNDGI